MPLDLKPVHYTTSQHFDITDSTGYTFRVSSGFDSEFGYWTTGVDFHATHGVGPEEGIRLLREACKRFLEATEEAETTG